MQTRASHPGPVPFLSSTAWRSPGFCRDLCAGSRHRSPFHIPVLELGMSWLPARISTSCLFPAFPSLVGLMDFKFRQGSQPCRMEPCRWNHRWSWAQGDGKNMALPQAVLCAARVAVSSLATSLQV